MASTLRREKVAISGNKRRRCPNPYGTHRRRARWSVEIRFSMTEQRTERRTEKTAIEARAGVTGQNVRYVLAASLIGVIILLAGLFYFWAA